MADGSTKPDMTWVWVAIAAVVVVGFFIFHQSIAPVKTPDITLVPKGSQDAYNPNSYPPPTPYPAYQQPAYPDPNSGNIAYYNSQATGDIANAAQNAAIANAAGDFLSNLTDNIFGSAA